MSEKDISEINIIYNIEKGEEFIQIFGSKFVENNRNICKMIINNKEYEITEEYSIKSLNNSVLNIKLKGIDNITDMSYMFSGCSSLLSVSGISNRNTNNATNMNYMFYKCSSLSSLPDITNLSVNNATNMSYMFYGCSSLSSLPDISKWNTNNIKGFYSMYSMFDKCYNLINSERTKRKFKL